MDDSKIINLQNKIKNKKDKILKAQRQLFTLKDRQYQNKLIRAGKVLEAAGILDTYDFDATVQTIMIHKEECVCQE